MSRKIPATEIMAIKKGLAKTAKPLSCMARPERFEKTFPQNLWISL